MLRLAGLKKIIFYTGERSLGPCQNDLQVLFDNESNNRENLSLWTYWQDLDECIGYFLRCATTAALSNRLTKDVWEQMQCVLLHQVYNSKYSQYPTLRQAMELSVSPSTAEKQPDFQII